jgi:putative hemolysin
VRETKTDRVVGCTRILTDEKARRLGRYYSDGEFELSAVRELPG